MNILRKRRNLGTGVPLMHLSPEMNLHHVKLWVGPASLGASAENMKIGSANRRERDTDHCFNDTGAKPRNLFYANVVGRMKDHRFHKLLSASASKTAWAQLCGDSTELAPNIHFAVNRG